MSTWNYLSTITFTQTGGGTYKPNTDQTDSVGQLTDADGALNVGDPLPGGTFAGTFTAGGATFIVVQSSPGSWLVYSPLSAADTQALLPSSVNQNNLDITPLTNCFAAGTLIATPSGETEVERLRVGDLVRAADGRVLPVRWIARQTVAWAFRPAERLMPVRFATGSLGDGLPHADLTVTADHAMLIDGVLCHAGALVNDTSITRVPPSEMGESFTVYHIETDEHEVILANGAPAETFIDNVSRRAFDNFAEYEALYGDERAMTELPLPRAMSVRQVPAAIREKLGVRRAA